MRRARAIASFIIIIAGATTTLARDDEKKKPDAPASQPAKKDDAKPESKPAPDLLPIPPELAKALERFDALGEPKREAARLVCGILNALLRRDVATFLKGFHKDLKIHTGGGTLEPMPADKLQEAMKALPDRPATKLTVDALLDLGSLRVFTKDEALKLEEKPFRKDPSEVAKAVMEKDDLILVVKTRVRTWSGGKEEDETFDDEIFYVLRREGERLKAVIGE